MAFYDFVRAADDIADNGALAADDKLARLDLFEHALKGDRDGMARLPKAENLRESLAESGVSDRHALDVLQAFKQDAVSIAMTAGRICLATVRFPHRRSAAFFSTSMARAGTFIACPTPFATRFSC